MSRRGDRATGVVSLAAAAKRALSDGIHSSDPRAIEERYDNSVRFGPRSAGGWLGIELRHLAALQAVAENASFVRAARQLGYTQSAISQQIAALERVVGEQLIERPGGPRPVELTDAGRLLMRHAHSIIVQLVRARTDIEALSKGVTGSVWLGAYQSVGARVLPLITRRFISEWPTADLYLAEGVSDESLLNDVERGDLDLTFADLPLPDGPFASEVMFRDPFVLVVNGDSPLAAPALDGEPRFSGLDHLRVVCLRSLRSTEDALAFLVSNGVTPKVVFQSNHNTTVQGMASAGVGAALIPRLSFDASDMQTVCVDLGPDAPSREVSLVWHVGRPLSPIASALMKLAKVVCAEIDHMEAARVRLHRLSRKATNPVR